MSDEEQPTKELAGVEVPVVQWEGPEDERTAEDVRDELDAAKFAAFSRAQKKAFARGDKATANHLYGQMNLLGGDTPSPHPNCRHEPLTPHTTGMSVDGVPPYEAPDPDPVDSGCYCICKSCRVAFDPAIMVEPPRPWTDNPAAFIDVTQYENIDPEHLADELQTDLTTVAGVGETKEHALKSEGFESLLDLKKADQSELADVIGIGNALAARIKADVGSITPEGAEKIHCPECGHDQFWTGTGTVDPIGRCAAGCGPIYADAMEHYIEDADGTVYCDIDCKNRVIHR